MIPPILPDASLPAADLARKLGKLFIERNNATSPDQARQIQARIDAIANLSRRNATLAFVVEQAIGKPFALMLGAIALVSVAYRLVDAALGLVL